MSLTVISPFKSKLGIDDQQFFNPVPLQDALGFFERGAYGHGNQIVLGHHGADGLIQIFFKAQVAVGQNAHEQRRRASPAVRRRGTSS